ncbi:uncharacterized protein LOC123550427 [Mercenaria mercenaria]|uniref:uncharacterized protein LOC123550427 n=1 Tax=Mercenaria mercenaria TaxID=6596 RepID=UPI00234EA12B|nr:uncharacterized protein LOC123550427 [Mercenaria mercenaria]
MKMLSIGTVVLVYALVFGNPSRGDYVKGAVQFRISETEFNKVVRVLLQPRDVYKVNVNETTIEGMYNGLSYELTDLNEKSKSHVVQVKMPSDGKMKATSFSSGIQYIGKLKITRKNGTEVVFERYIDASLNNVTLQSWGVSDMPGKVVPSKSHLPLDFSNCSSKIEKLSINNESLQNMGVEVANDDLKGIFQNIVCQMNDGKFSLAFGEAEVTFTIVGQPITVATVASDLKIKKNAIIITQKVKTSFKKENELPNYIIHTPTSFPLPDSSSQPFEIVLQANVFNELFREFKEKLGIGVKEVSLAELLPNFKQIAELDTQGLYMSILFPMVGKKYPNAVGTIVVSDADIYFSVKNGSVQMHFDITTALSVKLNCDKNRTYTALSFTLNLFFPAQIGYDNKYLTMKVHNFGGNFTVLNSTVGHVLDRALTSMLYSAPYYASGSLDKFNDMFRGIPLQDFLPKDIFAVVKSVSVNKNYVIVGGNLSPTDPQLPVLKRDKINWAGKVTEDDLFLLGRDKTPENPEGFELKEINCKKPPIVYSSASYAGYQAALVCFMVLILNVW